MNYQLRKPTGILLLMKINLRGTLRDYSQERSILGHPLEMGRGRFVIKPNAPCPTRGAGLITIYIRYYATHKS